MVHNFVAIKADPVRECVYVRFVVVSSASKQEQSKW
jgi:hypothetical protein